MKVPLSKMCGHPSFYSDKVSPEDHHQLHSPSSLSLHRQQKCFSDDLHPPPDDHHRSQPSKSCNHNPQNILLRNMSTIKAKCVVHAKIYSYIHDHMLLELYTMWIHHCNTPKIK
uniref:Uncharacterized protein n=1 Tax=Lactuca sativa TaxID=4236 RepID=A0A9R1VV96_LACSA|nr:hypothetical protein LSAT_V11C400175940 [Lactuca sativa]